MTLHKNSFSQLLAVFMPSLPHLLSFYLHIINIISGTYIQVIHTYIQVIHTGSEFTTGLLFITFCFMIVLSLL